jgi:hypothetical protein
MNFIRLFLSLAAIAAIAAIAAMPTFAADSFPDVSQLPAQPALPNPLVMFNGRRVATKEEWTQQRRPELKALFEHYMYGVMPPAPPHVRFAVDNVDKNFFNGKATKKEITISFSADVKAPRIHLMLIVPNGRPRSSTSGGRARGFPVFLGLNFYGNHTVVTDTNVALPTAWLPDGAPGAVDHHATEKGRGAQAEGWAVEQTIDRGYAFATFYHGDIEPDRPNAPDGLRAFLRLGDDAGTLAIWAWGMSRAVDYLVTDKDIDPRRIAAVGHSRNGKAVLLAAAFDERIALTIPLQAGCGGTAPSRGKIGESVKVINEHFPHWFNAEFKKFNDQPDRLPFDQHSLVALVAPRPVLFAAATEDTWANPAGQFEVLQAADPVYRFLGVGGLDAKQMPEVNQLVGSRLGYFIRPGKHSMTRGDWKMFLDFADKAMP